MAPRLAGKIAIVTGGASGIGKATCNLFASEGASVVPVDLNKEGLNEVYESLTQKYGDKHLQVCGDVSDSNFVKDVFTSVAEKYCQPATVLVNCAGILLSPCPFENSNEEKLEKILRVNLMSVFLFTRAFATALKDDKERIKKASVVNIASIAGKELGLTKFKKFYQHQAIQQKQGWADFQMPCLASHDQTDGTSIEDQTGMEYLAEYATSKAGIIAATKTIGKELGPKGFRCNAVLPGAIMTPMTMNAEASSGLSEEQLKEKAAEFTKTIPLRRMGQPEEVANVCLFLASDESSYVTCGCFEVTGGYEC